MKVAQRRCGGGFSRDATGVLGSDLTPDPFNDLFFFVFFVSLCEQFPD